MQDELEDHLEDYHSLTYEYWCDLLSTNEVRYERKREATQINNIDSNIAASLSDSNDSSRIQRKKKSRTDILRTNKGPKKKAHKHNGTQCYCVLYKKSGMPEQKYMSRCEEDCTGIGTNQNIKGRMGESVGSRDNTVKQFKNSENKWKKQMKPLKKQNNMLYRITKNSGSRHEINNIKKVQEKEILRRAATIAAIPSVTIQNFIPR